MSQHKGWARELNEGGRRCEEAGFSALPRQWALADRSVARVYVLLEDGDREDAEEDGDPEANDVLQREEDSGHRNLHPAVQRSENQHDEALICKCDLEREEFQGKRGDINGEMVAWVMNKTDASASNPKHKTTQKSAPLAQRPCYSSVYRAKRCTIPMQTHPTQKRSKRQRMKDTAGGKTSSDRHSPVCLVVGSSSTRPQVRRVEIQKRLPREFFFEGEGGNF